MPKTRPHRFSLVRNDPKRFKGAGLRPDFVYRDLGIRRATNGDAVAHVIRAKRPSRGGTGRHRHVLDFQMVYVLKGWATFWYEGKGRITVRPGDCVYQRPGIPHELIAWSRDMELLEIVMPAAFSTHPID